MKFRQISCCATLFTERKPIDHGTNPRVTRALRGNGHHDALGERGGRVIRFDSTLYRRAGDAAPAPTCTTSATRAWFAGGVPRRPALDFSTRAEAVMSHARRSS